MDRNRDLRSAASTVDGALRRRQMVTTLRDSAVEDKKMELKETGRLKYREQLRKKDGDRDLSKRMRIENMCAVWQRSCGENYRENTNVDSSGEDYFEKQETRLLQQDRMNQLPSSPNRRGIRTLRSSPVLRITVDEVLGVPVPRRARSAKKLHEHINPGSAGFGEDLTGRKFSPSPSMASPIGSGGTSTSSSGASMKKKKMKRVQPSISKSSSTLQDEIEIEVAEALYNLMKQSYSQSQSSERDEKVDRDSKDNDNDFKRLKAGHGKDDIGAFKVHNEKVIKEANKGEGIQKDKFPDEPVQELVKADRFVDRGKVEAAEERESPSCVKVNACDIQDPTVTKADYEPIVVDVGSKKGARREIDLMALPSLPSSPERDTALHIYSQVVAGNVQKKCATNPNGETRMHKEKSEAISGDQLLNLNLEQQRHDISSAAKSTTQAQQCPKGPKNQSPTSFLPFSIGIGSWPGVLSHLRYVPSHQADLPVDGSSQSSMTMQAPEFKFSQPRPKRSVTHRYIAENIHSHHQLVQKCLSSGSTDVSTMYGTKSSNLKLMLPTQSFIPRNPLKGVVERRQNVSGGARKDESSAVATDNNVTASAKSLLQQGLSQAQARASNFLHNPGFTFPLGGHHQAAAMAPPNSMGASQSDLPSNSSTKKPPANTSHLEASIAGTFNGSFFRSNEAASYMPMLQHKGCQFPIPPNIVLPSFKGGSILNTSYYSPPPVFNISPNQRLSTINTKTNENKMPQLEKKNDASAGDGSASHSPKPNNSSNNSNSIQIYSFPIQPMSFGHISNKQPPVSLPFPLSLGSSASSAPVISFSPTLQNSPIFQMLPEHSCNIGNKNFSLSEEKSRNAPSSSSATPPSKFVNLGKPVGFLPSHLRSVPIPTFYHHHQQQAQPKASPVQTDHSPLLPKWDNFPIPVKLLDGSSQLFTQHIPQPKNPEVLVQGHATFGNTPVLVQGNLPNSSKNKSSSNQRISSVSVLASQETEGSQTSSPACRRNVPSILGTCAGQLPELKY